MWALIVVALVASNAVACGTGCFDYNGSCACDQKPAVAQESYAVPSDEKPPRSRMPSYQDPSVKVDSPASLIAQDEKADEAKMGAASNASGTVYSIPESEVATKTN